MKRSHDAAMGGDSDDDQGGSLFVEDDDTDKIPPYDAKKEALPDCKIFTPEYKFIIDGKGKISDLVDAPFQESTFRSGPTEGLQEDHRRRVKDRSSAKIKIGVVGDMSSGKSSVLNSLLSVGVIARQGDAGSSCTWVVNEFGDLFPNQTKTYACEIYFFTQDNRHDILRALVVEYYRASPKDYDAGDGVKDADQATEDLSIVQGVIAALRALFGNYPEFSTVAKAHEFLSQAESEDDANIVDQLCEWSDFLMASILRGPCVQYEADTPQSLLLKIEPFQHTVEDAEGEPIISSWPFVSHIKFGMDIPLLKHVTLVDLPGLSDANKTRVANATAHLRQCTHYMVVANIGRATDDKTIRQHLSRGFVTRGSGRSILVLTHADSMDEATDVIMTRKGQQTLDDLTTKIEEAEKRKLELTHKIKKLSKGIEKYEAMETKDEVAKQIRALELQYKEIRIQMRSRNVVKQLQTIYADLTSDPLPLRVFCVGNAAYKKHQAGYTTDDPNPPTLSVLATEIPQLRKHILLAPMEGRLNEARNQIMIQIRAILASCELYVAKTHMARKDEIARMVIDPQYNIHSVIDSAFQELKDSADRTILQSFRHDEFPWTAEALRLCREWASRQGTAGHLKLLKQNGVRKETKRAKGVNWNGDLVNINTAEIRLWFGDFMPHIEATKKAIVKEVKAMVTTMSNTIRSDPQVALKALKPFLQYAYSEKATISGRAEDPVRHLHRDISNILRAATTDEINNPVVRAMAPIYDQASKIKAGTVPKGSLPAPRQRLDFFNSAVSRHGDGVWMAAHDLLRSDIFAVLDAHAEELKDAMMKFFVSIENRFNAMCAENGTEDEREAELRQSLSKNTVLARRIYEEELLPAAKTFFEG